MKDELATNLGKIIYRERTRKGISQEQLSRGICTQAVLSKIEHGKKIPEKLLADALMQRLGRCTDTLEAIMSKEEYLLFDIREELLRYFGGGRRRERWRLRMGLSAREKMDHACEAGSEACDLCDMAGGLETLPEDGRKCTFARQGQPEDVECGNGCDYWKIRELLQKYGEGKEAGQPLHQQFLCKCEAINEYRRDGDALQCRRALGKALSITFPQWRRRKLTQYYLCSQELHLLILLGYFWMDEDTDYAVRLLGEVGNYLEQRYYEEEKVKLFPQCMWLLALYWQGREGWDRVEEYSGKGVECLSKNGALPLMAELLRLKLESRAKLEQYAGGEALEEQHILQNELQSLEAALKRYAGWVQELDDLSRLHFFYRQDEISLDYEMIRDIRKNRGLTQGKLKSCTQSNLSRIESGRQNPTHTHFREIIGELGVRKSYYISRVQAEDYDLYEMAHWRNQACAQMDWEREAELIGELENKLDAGIPINRQYIEACRVERKKYYREISPDEGLLQLEQILRYTMPDYQDGQLRVPTREEFVIFDIMICFLRRQGRNIDGLELYKRLWQIFQNSSVREEYHTNSMLILYKNYGGMLEDAGELELAEEMDERGICLDIQCGKADLIGKILANLGCVYQKSDSPEKRILGKECFWNAYWLCLLMGQSKPAQIIKKML